MLSIIQQSMLWIVFFWIICGSCMGMSLVQATSALMTTYQRSPVTRTHLRNVNTTTTTMMNHRMMKQPSQPQVTNNSVKCGPQTPGDLRYVGGPVLTHVDIVPLFWPNKHLGKDGNVAYQSEINQFYKSISNSTYMDWLSEYCVPQYGPIGRGKSRNGLVLTTSPTKTNLTDLLDIQPYLITLYRQGILKPTNNTYFPIHFGPDITITLGPLTSCFDFCGYHRYVNVNTISNPVYVVYGINVDMGSATKPNVCSHRCSLDHSHTLKAVTAFASHELIEAITDPFPAYVQNVGGWVNHDATQEIGDLCDSVFHNFTDSTTNNNQVWTVSTGWSNHKQDCVSQ